MEKSKVYFTNFRAKPDRNVLQKLRHLIEAAGMTSMPLDGKFTAIKMHFGEPGNLAFLRPNYAKVVVDTLKDMGARPFLTDCNTLYTGMRRNALDHLTAAFENGFGPLQTGCHVIIADGLLGNDHVSVPIDGEYCKEALIGRAAMDADAIISLTHFKCHEGTGIGGALKNLGMGLGSTAGKRAMHCDGKPVVDHDKCIGCGMCARQCAHGAISFSGEKGHRRATIDHDKCVGCGRCLAVCPKDAIAADFADSVAVLNYKIAEYSFAVCKDRPCFHVSLICDVSPNCDCHAENDIPIIPNVGMLASFDPVALDKACADLCNQMAPVQESVLGENLAEHGNHEGHDHFHMTHPDAEWKSCIAHAVKIGLGTDQYELIRI